MTILTTERLRLEPFDDSHLDGLNEMNRDPEVMRYISGQPETREETLLSLERVRRRWAGVGYSWWSFIDRAGGGVVGAGAIQNLRRHEDEPDPAYPLEIGWRIRRDRWRQGLAYEAAVAMADFAFQSLEAPQLLAVCHPDNVASAAVMKKLGMRYRGIERWYEKDLATWEIGDSAWRRRGA